MWRWNDVADRDGIRNIRRNNDALRVLHEEKMERFMKYVEKNDPRETPKGDPREKQDLKPYPQTDKPWKQNPQHATDPSLGETPSPDLENWAESKTH